MENPLVSLEDQRAGNPGACRRFAYILAGALLAGDMHPRLIHIAQNFLDDSFNHTLVEVWIDSLSKWIVIDADYDTLYLIDNQPASMLELHNAVARKEFERISFARNGSKYLPEPTVYEGQQPSRLIKSFRHIYYATTNAFFDGYTVKLCGKKKISFLNYYDRNTPPYPIVKKKIALAGLIFTPCCLVMLVFLLIRKKRNANNPASSIKHH